MKTRIKIKARIKAFTGFGVEWQRLLIVDSVIHVYDDVAGHYTTCHSISERDIRRVFAYLASRKA